ncbi:MULTISPECIES: hypothetical protein [unclassified Photorhabdus]|uniref:hypothetical protein n=1 Tax=unclassified Photorhabdus TaxID=2620880 RepID=UPI001314BB4A|nr:MULTISPECIES: hypothetical protein [unclassified Photorhabdus]
MVTYGVKIGIFFQNEKAIKFNVIMPFIVFSWLVAAVLSASEQRLTLHNVCV